MRLKLGVVVRIKLRTNVRVGASGKVMVSVMDTQEITVTVSGIMHRGADIQLSQ